MRPATLGFLICGSIVAGAVSASAQWGRPQTPRVGACFYEHADFRGDYFCAPIGATVEQVPYDTNDRISSIRLFGNAEVVVHKDANFRGSSKRFTSDVYDLARAGFNDRISSYRIDNRGYGGGHDGHAGWAPTWGYERLPDAGVCFYEHPNFGGKYFCARHGAVVTQVPSGSNDRISSIRVFGNTQVTVFNDRGFSGGSRTLDHDARDLERAGWDDTISSFRVTSRRNGNGGNWGDGAYGGGRVTQDQARQVVRRAYLSVLGREPDSGSSGYVTKVMNDRWSQQQVESELRKSAEYRQKHGKR